MADVKWIKIVTDIFDDEKILMIETLPSSDSIIVIWFKLLCLAGKMNNDGVMIMNNRITYTDEMLAAIFRRDVNTVRMAMQVFENYGMIEVINNVITIPNWNKHQTLDAYEKKKERDRIYQQARRQKQRQLVEKSSDISSDCKQIESSYVAFSEEDKEKDKEKDKEIYITVISYLNKKAGTKYKPTSKKTQTCIHARIAEGYSVGDFKTVIDKKCSDWIGTDYEQYLRPETLFGTKFESYLNAKVTIKKHVNTGVPSGSQQDDLDGLF